MHFRKKLLYLLILAFICYYSGLFIISYIFNNFPREVTKFLFHIFEKNSLKFTFFILPFAGFFVTFCAALIELYFVGYSKSSLKKIFSNSPSTNTDLMYMLLRLSGATAVLASLFSFGNINNFVYSLPLIKKNLINSDVNLFVQVFILLFLHSLSFYIYHRIMHTKFFWDLHKTHHSATTYNVLLPYRNHFFDYLLATYVFGFFGYLAGGSNLAIFLATGINALYQSLVHSNISIKNKLIEYLIITPDLHKIHHSINIKNRNKNFGTFAFWDLIFGSYQNKKVKRLNFGTGSIAENQFFQIYSLSFVDFIKLQIFIVTNWLKNIF